MVAQPGEVKSVPVMSQHVWDWGAGHDNLLSRHSRITAQSTKIIKKEALSPRNKKFLDMLQKGMEGLLSPNTQLVHM